MQIYIPSRSRAKKSLIQAGPMNYLPASVDVTYVVPPEQVEDYQSVVPFNARVEGCPEKGIAATRRWIGEQCGEETFLMLDDDLRFSVRLSPTEWKLRPSSSEEVLDMLEHVDRFLKSGAYSHVGISPREGNNRSGAGDKNHREDNTRTLRALAYRTEDFLSVHHGRVDVMEDFDVNLQLLRMGKANTNLMFWAQDQRMTNADGGCSDYRSHEVHERSAKKLAELHQGFVRLRQKQNKTDRDGFGTRTEVTIQWKKAFQEGELK